MTLRITTYQNNNYKSNSTINAPVFKGVGNFSQNTFKHSKASKLLQPKNVFNKAQELIAEGMARGFGLLINATPMQKFISAVQNSKNGMMHLISSVSIMLTISTMNKIRKSEKIEEEQKLPLQLSEALTTAVTVTGGYTADKYLDKYHQKFVDTFNHVNKDLVAKNPEAWKSGLNLSKKLLITGFLYRYLGPVLVAPVSNKLSTKLMQGRKPKQIVEQSKLNTEQISIKKTEKVADARKTGNSQVNVSDKTFSTAA